MAHELSYSLTSTNSFGQTENNLFLTFILFTFTSFVALYIWNSFYFLINNLKHVKMVLYVIN